jgi:glycopeptide antibiotics resistance protein
LAFTFGTIIELLQSITPYSRESDVEDLFANALGILTMVIILRWKKQTVVKKLQTFM